MFLSLRFQSKLDETDARNSRGISPYAEFHQLVGDGCSKSQPEPVRVGPGGQVMRQPLPTKAYLRSTSEGKITRTNYDMLHSGSGSPVDSYDYLRTPQGREANLSQSPQPQRNQPQSQSHQSRGQHEGTPPLITVVSSSPRERRSASVDHLVATRSGLKHRRIYEQLSPKDADDMDTYVYMAPLKDFPDSVKQEQELQGTTTNATSGKVDKSGNSALDSSSELRSVNNVVYLRINY